MKRLLLHLLLKTAVVAVVFRDAAFTWSLLSKPEHSSPQVVIDEAYGFVLFRCHVTGWQLKPCVVT
jgi:hypothetical protein